jgi:site-specific DNA-methyltransferase (adenine-specific)
VFPKHSSQCGLHPTQKPIDLIGYFIRTYSNPGDTVLDNCMGSGTTGVAALRSSRQFIGIELEEKYFAVAENRLQTDLLIRQHET